MQSSAATVADYLASLPDDRRIAMTAVREVMLANIDPQYEEMMQYGMPGWSIPHSVYPPGYHCKPEEPVPFVGYASQKNHMAIYLMCLYVGGNGTDETDEATWFRNAWAASGKKKLDMGKSCVRFKKLDDVALDVIGEAVRRMPMQRYLDAYLKSIPKKK